ncbi:MAG: zonular occludens toxin domain-containing protein [Xanthobacteraceae bacterium]
MTSEVPDARFRLGHTFVVLPELSCDEGPARGVVIGRNNEKAKLQAVYLGKHAETPHKNVWMDIRGAHVLYVMGKRRSGKSYTLGSLAEGLVSKSWVRQGEFEQGVVVLDTMNVFLTMPFGVDEVESSSSPAVEEIRKWKLEPEPVSLDLYAPAGTQVPSELRASTITLRASDLGVEEWCSLFEVDPFVDPMGHLITLLISKLADEGFVDSRSGQRHKAKPDYNIQDMIFVLDVDADFDSFANETRQALRRRFDSLSKIPLFGTNGLDVRSLVRPSRISVLLLRDLDLEMRSVMVSLIVKKIMELRAISEQQERLVPIHLARAAKLSESNPDQAAVEKEKAQECADKAAAGIARTWLIIDEAHNYIPARSAVASKRPLKKYVDEGRNLGLSIVVATQQPAGLDPSIQRNADLLIIHSLSHQDDIAAAQGMLNTAIPEEVTLDGKYRITGGRTFDAMVRNLPLGYAIAATDRANRLIPICIRPRVTVAGGGDY